MLFLYVPVPICSMEYPLRDGKRTKGKSFKEFSTPNGTIIGVFQGNRGANPDLDIVVRYKTPGKRVRTPKHIHWAIDLLIKKEHRRELTLEFVKFLREMWDKVEPFTDKAGQQRCELKVSTEKNLERFHPLNEYGEYDIEFISILLELIMIQEKTGYAKAFMFKELLESIYKEADIFSIVSSSGHNRRG